MEKLIQYNKQTAVPLLIAGDIIPYIDNSTTNESNI